MGCGDQVVVFDDDVAHRARSHVQAQALPVIAVVEGDVDLVLRPGEKQAAPHGVLADCVDGRAAGDAVHDFGPGAASVVGAIDVRPHVVEADGVDGGISRPGIESSGVHDRDFGPRNERGRCHVRPVLPAVRGCVDQAVIGADPDAVDIDVRWGDRIDDAAAHGFRRGVISILADA